MLRRHLCLLVVDVGPRRRVDEVEDQRAEARAATREAQDMVMRLEAQVEQLHGEVTKANQAAEAARKKFQAAVRQRWDEGDVL